MKNFNSYNPQYRRYPYIRKPANLEYGVFFYGETADNTLLSPLFQSIAETPRLWNQIIRLPEDLKSKWEQQAIDGELTCMGIGGIVDLYSYMAVDIQNNSTCLFLTDKETGEILEIINLTPENLNKKLEELLPGGSSDFDQISLCIS